MTRLISSLGALALGLVATAASAVPIAGLYNTGVNNAGAALAADIVDTHYAFSVVTGTAVGTGGHGVVQKDANAELYAWTLNNAGTWNDAGTSSYSRWIIPAAVASGGYPSYDPSTSGVYDWTLQFNLSGFVVSSATINGKIGADNSVKVFLNGTQIAESPYDGGYNSYSFYEANATTFNITGGAGLNAGLNTLKFEVTNTPGVGNPTGLRTYFTSSVTPVPEPQTWALMGAGLALLTLAAYRRRATQGL